MPQSRVHWSEGRLWLFFYEYLVKDIYLPPISNPDPITNPTQNITWQTFISCNVTTGKQFQAQVLRKETTTIRTFNNPFNFLLSLEAHLPISIYFLSPTFSQAYHSHSHSHSHFNSHSHSHSYSYSHSHSSCAYYSYSYSYYYYYYYFSCYSYCFSYS